MDPRQLLKLEDVDFDNEALEGTVVGGWRVARVIGSGTFGHVVEAHGPGGEVAALKLMPRGDQIRQYSTYVMREIVHHSSLLHPFVVALKEVLLTDQWLGIMSELCAGGDLCKDLQQRRPGRRLAEPEARWLFQQLVIGLSYAHARGVANRDLKLENLLLDRAPSGLHGDWPLLKICDWGYSKHELNSIAKTSVGTMLYMAPEVLAGADKYDAKKADVWSCGVILFVMLFGHYPFDPAVKDFADRLACGRWAPPGAADIASPACLALLGRMLHPIAAQRMELGDILSDPWFLEHLPPGAADMNGWYLKHAPDREPLVPRIEAMVEQAAQEGRPGEPTQRITFERIPPPPPRAVGPGGP